jgi:hypothetical protein
MDGSKHHRSLSMSSLVNGDWSFCRTAMSLFAMEDYLLLPNTAFANPAIEDRAPQAILGAEWTHKRHEALRIAQKIAS